MPLYFFYQKKIFFTLKNKKKRQWFMLKNRYTRWKCQKNFFFLCDALCTLPYRQIANCKLQSQKSTRKFMRLRNQWCPAWLVSEKKEEDFLTFFFAQTSYVIHRICVCAYKISTQNLYLRTCKHLVCQKRTRPIPDNN